jgi:hypothetical protein
MFTVVSAPAGGIRSRILFCWDGERSTYIVSQIISFVQRVWINLAFYTLAAPIIAIVVTIAAIINAHATTIISCLAVTFAHTLLLKTVRFGSALEL